MKCLKCNEALVYIKEVDQYLCQNCKISYSQKDLQLAHLPWTEKINQQENLWFTPAFDTFPSIVAHEYYRIKQMFGEGQSYGAFLQMKDLFEVLLKFPTLVAFSGLYHSPDANAKTNEILAGMLERPLSLGTWQTISQAIQKECTNPVLRELLKKTLAFFNKNKIVNWRNEYIGHGALTFDTNTDFQKDLEQKLVVTRAFLEDAEELFLAIDFIVGKKKPRRLRGKDFARKIEHQDEQLFAHVAGEQYPLFPFILLDAKEIFFFDSYYAFKHRAAILNYPEGIKNDRNEEVNSHFQNAMKELNITSISENYYLDDNVFSLEDANVIEKLTDTKDFLKPTYLVDWLEGHLNQKEKAVLLLEMERGTGKTTFSRALDTLALNKIKLKNVTTRTYYINNSYKYKPHNFTQGVFDALRKTDEGKMLIGGIKGVSTDSKDKREAFARMLNEFHQEYARNPRFGKEKLLLVIDGLDEIPKQTVETIFDYIPTPDMLDDDVYILLTCRTTEELTDFTKDKLASASLTDRITFTKEDKNNIAILRDYIERHFQFDAVPEEAAAQTALILQKADYRFIYVQTFKALWGVVKQHQLQKQLPESGELFQFYLKSLKELYGEKFYHSILDLLIIISTAYTPLKLREVSYLFGEERPTFKLLAFLQDLQGFIKVERTEQSSLITISHDEWKQTITHYFRDEIGRLVSGWVDKAITLEELQNVDWKTEELQGESYLIAMTHSYVRDYAPELEEKLDRMSFYQLCIQAHKSMRGLRVMDSIASTKCLEMLNTVIELIKRVYHGKEMDRQKFFHFANALEHRAVFYEFLMEYERAIEEFQLTIQYLSMVNKEEFLEVIAHLYVNIGNTYIKLSSYDAGLSAFDVAEQVLHESDKTIKDQTIPASISSGRATAYRSKGEPEIAIQQLTKAVEILRSVDLEQNHEAKKLLIKILDNRRNLYSNLKMYKLRDLDIEEINRLNGYEEEEKASLHVKVEDDVIHISTAKHEVSVPLKLLKG